MNGKSEEIIQMKPKLAKVLFVPFGIISFALWGLYFIGISILFIGISKVGMTGVVQSFKNNSDVTLGLVKTLGIIIMLQIILRILAMQSSIRLERDAIIVRKWMRTVKYPMAKIKKITDVISIASIGHMIHLKYADKVLTKKIDMRLYTEKEVRLFITFIQSVSNKE